jgi:hypothetical protein
MAQAWIWANRADPELAGFERDDAATSLASLACDHPLWELFADTQARECRGVYADFNHEDWGAASRPRPVPPDCEIVRYMRCDGEILDITEPMAVKAHDLLMRHTPDGWLLRGFSDTPRQPGWPPS